jgi:hypothetical protein
MPQADISFGPFQESSYDALGGASPRAINVVIDPKGVVSKRPGIASYDAAPSGVVDDTGITGLYVDNTSQLFAVGGRPGARHIYKLLNGNAVDLSLAPNSTLRGTRRPTFAETELYLVMAGGADMQKLHLVTLASTLLGGAPPLASHVVANASRLAANDLLVDKTKVRFSGVFQGTVDVSGMEQWDNTGLSEEGGFFTAEARPDPVMAVHENTNEIFVWGKDNVQIFVPDAPPAIFVPAATRESGTLAPYSIIKQGQDFFWLDQHRRIVYSDGRSFQNLEGPIKKQLDELTHPTDCFGYRVFVGHIDCLVWTFPTDGRTFVYQVGGGWSEWSGWDAGASQFKSFIVNAHYLRRDGGLNVVGTVDGRIGRFALGSFSDRGERVVAYVESGFINRDTDNLKRCRSVKFAIRRGHTEEVPVVQPPPTETYRTYGRASLDEDYGMGIGNPGSYNMGIDTPSDPASATVIHASVESVQTSISGISDTIAMFSGVTHVRLEWLQGGGGFVRYTLDSVTVIPGDADYFQIDVAAVESDITFPFDVLSYEDVVILWLEAAAPTVLSPSAALCRVEWRDDTGPWNQPLFIDVGFIGDNHCVRELRSLGTYRRRQWRFSFSDDVNLSLLKVTENFDVLGS